MVWRSLLDWEPLTSCYFPHLWKQRCTNIHERRAKTIQKCSLCLQFQDNWRKYLDNRRALDSIRKGLDKRFAVVFEERTGYFKGQRFAQNDPHRHYSMIVDSSGQVKFRLSHFVE